MLCFPFLYKDVFLSASFLFSRSSHHCYDVSIGILGCVPVRCWKERGEKWQWLGCGSGPVLQQGYVGSERDTHYSPTPEVSPSACPFLHLELSDLEIWQSRLRGSMLKWGWVAVRFRGFLKASREEAQQYVFFLRRNHPRLPWHSSSLLLPGRGEGGGRERDSNPCTGLPPFPC